jgi:dihydrofolate reductase
MTGAGALWHVTMSLDGFIAGPGDRTDFVAGHVAPGERSPLAGAAMAQTGAILAGRRWHDVAARRYGGRGGIYGGAWSGPVLVLTHRPDPPPDDPGITYISGPITEAMAAAQAAAGDRRVGVFGADVARQCLEAGLLDELVVHVAPVLLGGGVRLYGAAPGGAGHPSYALQCVEQAASGPIADLRYRVVGASSSAGAVVDDPAREPAR